MTQNIEKRLEIIEQKLDAQQTLNSNIINLSSRSYALSENEIDLHVLWNELWRGKWLILLVTLLFSITSVFYAISLSNVYKSEALLAPSEENSGGGLAAMAGQLGGLASLAGVNLGGRGNDKTTLALEVLRSRKFVRNFIDKHGLLIPLLASEGWDSKTGELVIDKKLYDIEKDVWLENSKFLSGGEPNAHEIYMGLMSRLSISEDKKTKFVRISFEFYSPSLAKKWIDFMVEDINEEIRQRDVSEAKESIDYLTHHLDKIPVATMQSVFYELIEEQTKTMMFAEVRDEYVFKVIDPPVVPEIKYKPKRSLILIFFTMLGGILGTVIVLARYWICRKSTETE